MHASLSRLSTSKVIASIKNRKSTTDSNLLNGIQWLWGAKRRKTCSGGCNTNAGNEAIAAMCGKTYGSCSISARSYATAAMRGKTCSCRKTSARNCATALIGGKTCGGCNTSTRSYVTTAMRGKTCNGCNTNAGIYAMELLPCAAKPVAVAISQGCNVRLQYKRGKLCSCCHARENLRWLQYKRGKLCNCCHKRETSGGCNTSAGKPVAVKNKRGNLCRRTAAMSSKTCGR